MPRTITQDRIYVVACDEYVTKPQTKDRAERTLRDIETAGHCRAEHRIVTLAEYAGL